MTLPSIERLRELLSYDPETGDIQRRGRPRRRYTTRGPRRYLSIMVDGRHLQQHRVAFAMHHGRWPEGDVDHRNGLGNDNRAENLRECSRAENNQNQGVSRNSTSGVTGVSRIKRSGRWRAHIVVDRQQKHLGVYATKEEAATAYATAKKALHDFHSDAVERRAL